MQPTERVSRSKAAAGKTLRANTKEPHDALNTRVAVVLPFGRTHFPPASCLRLSDKNPPHRRVLQEAPPYDVRQLPLSWLLQSPAGCHRRLPTPPWSWSRGPGRVAVLPASARRLAEASVGPHTRRPYVGALRRLDAWLGGREPMRAWPRTWPSCSPRAARPRARRWRRRGAASGEACRPAGRIRPARPPGACWPASAGGARIGVAARPRRARPRTWRPSSRRWSDRAGRGRPAYRHPPQQDEPRRRDGRRALRQGRAGPRRPDAALGRGDVAATERLIGQKREADTTASPHRSTVTMQAAATTSAPAGPDAR